MGCLLDIPHRRAHGLCPINGIRDLIHWRTGRDWSNEFLHGLGLGGGFAYLRFNLADPPRQVYWGNASPRQHKYLAELFGADYTELENRAFQFTWKKAQQAVTAGLPPIIGPLDMFYLHYYDGIYHERHIPIHYVLLVGFDDKNAHVLDTDRINIQSIALQELALAWDVNVPGMGKRNRLVTLNIPAEISATDRLVRQSILDECSLMLKPPVSMLGIPAMQKLARDIQNWPSELGQEMTEKCLQQLLEYLNSPPDLTGDHLTAGRDIYITFLEEASLMAGLDISPAIMRLRTAMQNIPQIAKAVHQRELRDVSAGFTAIAEQERQAFTLLKQAIEPSG